LFTQTLWQLALSIPTGRVTTYATLAVAAGGHPMMAQMVTHILGKYPHPEEIPWHRIVYANGRVWFDPERQKERLAQYQKEGIELDKDYKIKDFEKIIYTFPDFT
ncbi:MAG: MGMT family protein, partial [Oligoflexia bacterium]|nr:MGMT family protein [Oligoflexia bacterium]